VRDHDFGERIILAVILIIRLKVPHLNKGLANYNCSFSNIKYNCSVVWQYVSMPEYANLHGALMKLRTFGMWVTEIQLSSGRGVRHSIQLPMPRGLPLWQNQFNPPTAVGGDERNVPRREFKLSASSMASGCPGVTGYWLILIENKCAGFKRK